MTQPATSAASLAPMKVVEQDELLNLTGTREKQQPEESRAKKHPGVEIEEENEAGENVERPSTPPRPGGPLNPQPGPLPFWLRPDFRTAPRTEVSPGVWAHQMPVEMVERRGVDPDVETGARSAADAPGTDGPLPGDVNGPYGLNTAERNWARLQPELEKLGYMLRPRYRPGWVGSWVGTRKRPEKCADSVGIGSAGVLMDAVRMKDGSPVMLKLWSQDILDGPERDVLRYFSDPARRSDPDNHVIPLLDVLTIPGWESAFDGILVEPRLEPCQEPPFVMVAEYLCYLLQLVEGLDYMHSHNVAHGDIHRGNIMMDPSPVKPRRFLGIPLRRPRWLPRWQLMKPTRIQSPPKYYYIDFGSSTMFPSVEDRRPVVSRAAVWEPPEWFSARDEPLDAFKADVYILGVTVVRDIENRPRMHFVVDPFEKALEDDPNVRATAAELRASFLRLLSTIEPSTMRARIGWVPEPFGEPLTFRQKVWDSVYYYRVLVHSYVFGLPKELLRHREKESWWKGVERRCSTLIPSFRRH